MKLESDRANGSSQVKTLRVNYALGHHFPVYSSFKLKKILLNIDY